MSAKNQFELLKEARFGPFFVTQSLGAFNDNLFKYALIMLITFQVTDAGFFNSNTLINLASGLFILPFFLFSATSGQLADKYEKAWLIRRFKLLEIAIMVVASVGFYTGNIPLLIMLLFMMGLQSTLFGPVKYGILPQHLTEEELVSGNGMVSMGTFLAILLGTMAGGILIGLSHGALLVSGLIIGVACLGYWTSRGIPVAKPPDLGLQINWNPLTETVRNIDFARRNRTVFLSILGISWFWLLGSAYLTQLSNYTKLTLGGNEQVVTVLLTLFSIGVGVGSLLCERMSGHKVEIGLVPFGSIGLSLFGIDIFFATPDVSASGPLLNAGEFLRSPENWRVMVDIFFLGIFGGFYIVPLLALVQQRSDPSHRSRVIAANNILNALFMVGAAVLAIVLLNVAGLTISQLFLVIALLNAGVAVYIYTLVPEFLMRFLVWLLIHTVYRIREEGLERIPDEGPVVLVCNHVSFVDALVIAGCCRRPVRFVIDHKIYRMPVLNFIFRTAGTIPIAPARVNREMLKRSYERIGEYLDNGEVVCIFPEGKITHDGNIGPFRNGIERILRRNPVPVIPMALQGLWGSFFSRKYGPAMQRLPRRFWSRIALVLGPPVPPEEVTAKRLNEMVVALRGDWM